MDDIILILIIGMPVLLLVGLPILIIYEMIMESYYKTLRYETFPSTAKVYVKDGGKRTITTGAMIGKLIMPRTRHYDEEYYVYLMYEGELYWFADRKLYNSVNEGDMVQVLVHKGYNKQNELKHVYLDFKE